MVPAWADRYCLRNVPDAADTVAAGIAVLASPEEFVNARVLVWLKISAPTAPPACAFNTLVARLHSPTDMRAMVPLSAPAGNPRQPCSVASTVATANSGATKGACNCGPSPSRAGSWSPPGVDTVDATMCALVLAPSVIAPA